MKKTLTFLILLLELIATDAQQNNSGIAINKKKSILTVNNSPFLALGGELGNSSASSMAYM